MTVWQGKGEGKDLYKPSYKTSLFKIKIFLQRLMNVMTYDIEIQA